MKHAEIDFAALRTLMVDRQVRPSDVTSFPIIEAMLSVPRERYAPAALRAVAYAEAPLRLAPGRETLAPRVFAKLLDAARIGPDDLVLDLFPGLGYSTAVIARIAAAVIALEPDEGLAAAASATLAAENIDNALMLHGDAASGDAAHGPYDAIFMNGGVAREPAALTSQLKEGGRLVAIRIEGAVGRATAWTRIGDRLEPRPLFDAAAAILPGFEPEESFAF